jgi:hypothetical protein
MIEISKLPPGCSRVWQVWVNTDSIEGRGQMKLFGQFVNRHDAEEAAQGKGPMGASDGDIREGIICDSMDAFKAWKQDERRQRALSKLTFEDKQILGLL